MTHFSMYSSSLLAAMRVTEILQGIEWRREKCLNTSTYPSQYNELDLKAEGGL
jgi:hypothetical protein